MHFPSESNQVDRNFYLPHFSTDTQYSLKPGDHPRISLNLGLGDDFDVSFDEALRRGVGGEEMPLPHEALRVLSEAKENLDMRMSGKQGRKGSIGMGLFKETRAAIDKERRKRDVLLEEKEEEDSPKDVKTPKRAATPHRRRTSSPPISPISPTPVRAIPIPSSNRIDQVRDELDSPLTSAGIRIVSSPLLDRESTRQNSDADDSDWTTASEVSFSSLSMSEDEDVTGATTVDDLEMEEPTEGDDDEERMRVPLQPFNHAVGGHSSIYKFTRRAVCKVSHLSGSQR